MKKAFNWNKKQSKNTNQTQSRHLYFLIHPSFQGVNKLFVLLFKSYDDRESYRKYYLPTVEIKDYNIIIDERNSFDQSIKNNLETYDNIRKIATDPGDDYTT